MVCRKLKSDGISVNLNIWRLKWYCVYGSVLFPVLFAMYAYGLLSELCASGVGCHWGSLFVGDFL